MAEQTYPERTKVKVNDLKAPFLVTRIGAGFTGKYGLSYPVEAVLSESGIDAVIWVNGDSVIGKQIKSGEIETQTVYEVVEGTSSNGRQYRVFRSLDG
jgi:hypothetical protein